MRQILFVIGMSVLFVACKKNKNSRYTEDKTPIAILTKTSVQVPQIYVADIQAVQYVEIRPKIEGFVEAIYVDEGQVVKKGQQLFKLNSSVFDEKVKQAQANLKEAQANLKKIEYEVGRIQRIVEEDIISPIRLEQARAEQEAAKMKVKHAQAELQQAQTYSSYATITAPFDGIIDRIPHKTGSLVTPASLLTAVTDVSEVFVYFNFNEMEYLNYKRHLIEGNDYSEFNNVELILPDGSEYPYKGKVESIGADFERQTGSISLRARFSNPDGLLKHGGTGKISVLSEMQDVYLVPQKATFEIQDFTYIYTVDAENRVGVRSFVPLARQGNFYITKDIDERTAIVYEGIQMLKDGMKIIPDTIDYRKMISTPLVLTASF